MCLTPAPSWSLHCGLTIDADFLRLSRAGIDDSINQGLNALQMPSRSGFDPASTSTRAPRVSQRQIDPTSCRTFKEEVLFPSWQARTEVLQYCGLVATSTDPDDPEAMQRKVEDAKAQERVVDERLDPYSARYFPREPRTEQLALLLRQEKGIESIVRARTWNVVSERCGQPPGTWQDAYDAWRVQKAL